jgi:hypothetical protein
MQGPKCRRPAMFFHGSSRGGIKFLLFTFADKFDFLKENRKGDSESFSQISCFI